ncbi:MULTISPECIES: SDR family NAD(P)-dependent oxidoreductase [Catenuloplanes]|uniref:NAD(P)-dependent dehydrogenase (Short-subunit alcohol dehydrogenase family) n=1 Tax=Catenuloplanes niger TaxID=587534 RepID=A0AAE4CW01_9ACTN|nr:SDR family oxidoreductase [Catenuloplanes niger]MDR7325977.1 NAD(P)-dependent dehydrogenase (short-subunit alcohol dehydrogenase family) [Catenuloplanes niger]
MGQLDGRTAVVTGGSKGIGLATARRFAAEGAYVFITGRSKPELDAAVDSIGAATGIPGDVSDPADLDRLFEAVRQAGRTVDVLFANAGGGAIAALGTVTEQQIDYTLGLNVRGTLLTVQKALPLLNDGASVILTGSSAAVAGAEGLGVYAASKAAVRSLARTWANELRGRGIRVNTVAPGPIDTPGVETMAAETGQALHDLRAYQAGRIPLGRMGRADEVAGTVLFLASDASTFITGTEIYVDGGENQI